VPGLRRCRRLSVSWANAPAAASSNSLPRTSATATRARPNARAVKQFFDWTDKRRLELHEIEAITVAAYIEQLGATLSKPTVKQHLAAIRRLFDYLTTGGILDVNPASAVRGPKYVVRRGKTPVLSAEEARKLLDSIESNTLIACAGPGSNRHNGLQLRPCRRDGIDASGRLFPASQALVAAAP
jgi:integrase